MAVTPAPIYPGDLPPRGSLLLQAGSYVANTDDVTITGPGVALQGVLYNGIAAFSVDKISLGSGVVLTVTGSHPLALVSSGDAAIAGDAKIELSARGSADGSGASGAGCGRTMMMVPGSAGGGGGFGGRGGILELGGKTYGDLRVALEGGSHGGKGWDGVTGDVPYGGGGGVIEIAAAGSLVLDGTGGISTNGDNGGPGHSGGQDPVHGIYFGAGGGGGGSGGGILLIGNSVTLTSNLSAKGGTGGDTGEKQSSGPGGGGGGGRVTILYGSGEFKNTGKIDVSGGTGPQPGEPGVVLSEKQSGTGRAP